MEPNASDQPEQAQKNSEADMNSTVNDLRNEGVDIVGQEGTEPSPEIQAATPAQPPSKPFAPRVSSIMPSEGQPTMTQSLAQDEINQTLGASSGAGIQASLVQNDPSIKSLRTFKSDAEEAVRYKNVSAAQIALAEQNKRLAKQELEPKNETDSHKSLKGPVLMIALAILALAGGGAYYWATVIQPNPTVALPQELRVQTIIPYAKASLVNIDPKNDPLLSIGEALRDATAPESSIYAIVPVPIGTTTVAATSLEIFGETSMPDMLKRSLSQTYMVGSYISTSKSPFFILKNTYFQNAFAGMLEWEKDMRNDLIALIAVSHPEETTALVNSLPFEDSVISNIDSRVLKNSKGDVVLAYAFSDQSTVIVTTSVDSLKKLLDKLLAVRVVQ
jgi:hypothetical protein